MKHFLSRSAGQVATQVKTFLFLSVARVVCLQRRQSNHPTRNLRGQTHANPLKVSQWFLSFSDFKENIWATFSLCQKHFAISLCNLKSWYHRGLYGSLPQQICNQSATPKTIHGCSKQEPQISIISFQIFLLVLNLFLNHLNYKFKYILIQSHFLMKT